ncbi:hypothetical protein [Arcobacter sp. F2176]|uniref:hypothetical protein n=1 Tax=Arcobacter sp. F2176 TaxID=2044511 RepID=UPI00100BBBFA|nr:hypothetical protein [Arcobacter sp. F2176]RXJ79860.1 hypothetical protein CRU95_12745 [Arcobacter sp. F2176]
MKKIVLITLLLLVNMFAHPVSYTMDIQGTYDKVKKELFITCKSSSRNKCGLYNIHVFNKNKKILLEKKFPFLKKSIKVQLQNTPEFMEFYLRDIPEHKYIIYVK